MTKTRQTLSTLTTISSGDECPWTLDGEEGTRRHRMFIPHSNRTSPVQSLNVQCYSLSAQIASRVASWPALRSNGNLERWLSAWSDAEADWSARQPAGVDGSAAVGSRAFRLLLCWCHRRAGAVDGWRSRFQRYGGWHHVILSRNTTTAVEMMGM